MPGTRTDARHPFGVLASWLGGLALVAGMATSAEAQQPGGRAAALLPPRPTTAADVPVIARGAIDDTIVVPLASTPVTRPGTKVPVSVPGVAPRAAGSPSGPAWLSGADPGVVPAAGITPVKPGSDIRPHALPPTTPARLTPPPSDPSLVTKGWNKLKGMVSSDQPPAKAGMVPPGTPTDPQAAPPDPNAPLQGMGPNGAPVLAGPPAWRWYGYGSVTPGANTFAPSGQYPRASANWYSVTRATPGAFPVPVVNPYRTGPGSEPPTYATGPVMRPAPPAGQFGAIPPEPVRAMTPPRTNPLPAPLGPPRPSPGAGGTTPLAPSAVRSESRAPAVPPPVGIPLLAPPPTMTPTAALPLAPLPPADLSEPVGLIPVVAPSGVMPGPKAPEPIAHLPAIAPLPAVTPPVVTPPVATKAVTATKPVAGPVPVATLPVVPPAALPDSVTDEVRWQSTPGIPASLPPGTWLPATATPPPPQRKDATWQPGAAAAPRPVARGQVGDTDPKSDPVADLIRAVCRDQARDVDVRWTGSKKLTVCFEVRGEPAGAKLVKDISARPELAPFQIDFCVLVK
jgi:hypothetical protein